MIADRAVTPVIAMQDAAFGYADRVVVSGVSLRVGTGEVVALLGANGSGKTTIVRGLLGLNPRLGGTVQLFGTPIEAFTEHHRIGYVPQRHTLSGSVRATVEEIVAVGRLPHQPILARTTRHDRAVIGEALELVGLHDRAREDVATLSGGQQRRVLIARALAAQPDVLVMDEPTAGVDTASQQVLAEVLDRLSRGGKTMLIVTHELIALGTTVSRIICTAGGGVVFDGSPDGYAAYAARQARHLAEGHHHHHDLTEVEPSRLRTVGAGPLDRGARRRATRDLVAGEQGEQPCAR